MVSACEMPMSLLGAGQPLDRAVTAISPLTRSLEGAATLFRTRPLPCHHPLTGNWDGSLISTRSHWRISSRTTEANASRFSAKIAKRWEPGLASDGVMVTIGFTCPGASRLATPGDYGVIESRSEAFGDGFSGAAALTGLKEKRAPVTGSDGGALARSGDVKNQERVAYCFRSQRCAAASQTHSVNRRVRSGKSGSPLL
jgi:hypothetical protein